MAYGYTGMNLEKVITSAIIPIVPKKDITLYIFGGQTIDDSGLAVPIYATLNTVAQIQLKDKQELTHSQHIGLNTVIKTFYIQSFTLSGLNRSLNTAGDYIYLHENSMYYKIIELPENFKTGWVNVTGAESPSITGLGT